MKQIHLPSGKLLKRNSITVEGINWNDSPDFVDAFIGEARYLSGGDILNDKDLEWLNEQPDLLRECVERATEGGRPVNEDI